MKDEINLSEIDNDFEYQIKERGLDYYKRGLVLECYKNNDEYYAKVKGTQDNIYSVYIDYYDDSYIDYSCDCPYGYPCKHIYATILAINNKKYIKIKLKPTIKEKKKDLLSMLEIVPAKEIKKYILSSIDKVQFDLDNFYIYFKKYQPKQKYKYYYNNLYNKLILNKEVNKLLDIYLNNIKQYISSKEYIEAFKILKSIIEAYNDSNRINTDSYIINILPIIGMFLRIIYRKSDVKTKKDIDSWINYLIKHKYYDNVYLEDIVIILIHKQ